MAENKTTENKASVPDFIKSVADEGRRKDCQNVVKMIKEATGLPPKMWGSAIIGFGSYHYVYESGREGDMPLVGISPRKDSLVFYLGSSFEGRDELLEKLGKHKVGKGCLYIKKLEDVNADVLKKMVVASVKHRKKNPSA